MDKDVRGESLVQETNKVASFSFSNLPSFVRSFCRIPRKKQIQVTSVEKDQDAEN